MNQKGLRLLKDCSGYKGEALDLHSDPALPLKIVEHLVENDLTFPLAPTGDYEVVYRVCEELRSGCLSPDTIRGLGLNQEDMSPSATALKCFLINGYDYATVAKYTGESVGAIEVFEKLCFNVLNRLKDGLYIAGIVYPDYRLGALAQGAFETTDPELLLLQACYEDKHIPRIMHLNGLRMTDEELEEYGAKSWVDLYGEVMYERKVAEYQCMVVTGNLLHNKRLTKPLMDNWKLQNMKKAKLGQSQVSGGLFEDWKAHGY